MTVVALASVPAGWEAVYAVRDGDSAHFELRPVLALASLSDGRLVGVVPRDDPIAPDAACRFVIAIAIAARLLGYLAPGQDVEVFQRLLDAWTDDDGDNGNGAAAA